MYREANNVADQMASYVVDCIGSILQLAEIDISYGLSFILFSDFHEFIYSRQIQYIHAYQKKDQ